MGYNVYQARLYDITDEIAFKHTFVEQAEAEQCLLNYFKDEKQGVLYARAVIRKIDPRLVSWIIPWSVDNPNALLFDTNAVLEGQRINYYDLGDCLIKTEVSDKHIPSNRVFYNMMKMNAFYATRSCREIGSERYVISETYRNNAFNLTVIQDKAAKARMRDTSIPLEDKYKHLLEQDKEETIKINQKRAQINGGNT